MILLASTNDKLRLVTSSSSNTDVHVSWADLNGTTVTPGRTNTATISSATTTDILASPGASTYRTAKTIAIRNRGTSSQTVTVIHTDGTNALELTEAQLGPDEQLHYDEHQGWRVINKYGTYKSEDTTIVGDSGLCLGYFKIGTASEAIGVRYGFAKDTGSPGAWAPGAPGVNGWWVDATQASNAANPAGASQAGCYQLQNPASGDWYLNDIGMSTSTAHLLEVYDLIWYNTGINVTTTGAQAIAMPGASKPARDLYGTTNGEGWNAFIYVTTATTNAGAVTNTTMSYTDSDGNAGNTATISSFPATAVAGTLVPFQLVSGDRGIRSIESVTLGTSYGGGAISIVLMRKLATVPNPVANVGGIMNKLTSDPTGIKLYSGTALWLSYLSSATTATNLAGSIQLVSR